MLAWTKYFHAWPLDILHTRNPTFQIHFFFFSVAPQPNSGLRRHVVGVYGSRTPMNERSFRQRGHHLHDTQWNTKDKHPCPYLDSNPRSQRWSGFRLTPWTAQQPDRFMNPLKNFITRPFYSVHSPTWYYIYPTSVFFNIILMFTLPQSQRLLSAYIRIYLQ